jgi:hypothetical protein
MSRFPASTHTVIPVWKKSGQEPTPHASDAVVAIVAGGVRAGLRASVVVTVALRPITAFALRPENWPSQRLRELAETGFRQRQRAVAELVRLFRQMVPVVVTEILDQLDIDSIAARVDIEAIVSRLDLVGLAQYVVAEIDLSEIIRESTGSVASEAVRDVRIRTIEADQVVSRWVGRTLHPWRPHAAPATGTDVAADRHDS